VDEAEREVLACSGRKKREGVGAERGRSEIAEEPVLSSHRQRACNFERGEPIPSSIHAYQSKRRLVREEISERKRVKGAQYHPMPTLCCGAGQDRGSLRGENDQCATPPLCQGLRHRRGQCEPIVHIVQLTLAGCCQTSCMKLHCSTRVTRTARTVTPCEGAHSGPSSLSGPVLPRALVLIPGWTRNASRGTARQNSHLSLREIFAIGLPIVRSSDNARFCVTLPWRSVGWQCKRDRTIQPPQRRLVGSKSANLAGRVGGER
jgi:hypothetical protein